MNYGIVFCCDTSSTKCSHCCGHLFLSYRIGFSRSTIFKHNNCSASLTSILDCSPFPIALWLEVANTGTAYKTVVQIHIMNKTRLDLMTYTYPPSRQQLRLQIPCEVVSAPLPRGKYGFYRRNNIVCVLSDFWSFYWLFFFSAKMCWTSRVERFRLPAIVTIYFGKVRCKKNCTYSKSAHTSEVHYLPYCI